MSSEYLDSYIENSESDIEETIPKLVMKPDFDTAIELSLFYRQHGTCKFLLTGNTAVFVDCMHRSTGSFLYFLINGSDDNKRTSENEPYFDAVVGGCLEGAKQLARHARSSCNFDYEYEDDFLFTHFLLSFFLKGEKIGEFDCKKILIDYENLLNGKSDIRLELCKAFHNNDAHTFNESLSQFLDEREKKIDTMIEREAISEDIWSWSKYVSVEGLALLKFASMMNFKTYRNYSQCPEALRILPQINFNPGLWRI